MSEPDFPGRKTSGRQARKGTRGSFRDARLRRLTPRRFKRALIGMERVEGDILPIGPAGVCLRPEALVPARRLTLEGRR